MSDTLYDIPVTTISGEASTLSPYAGKVLLVVNVASKCGLTPQYEGLQKLYGQYHDQGLEILGFPANNFLGQEPGSEAEIQSFCSLNYQVSFPLFAKISVKGEDQHPLYRHLTAAKPEADIAGPEFEARLAGFGQTREQPADVLWNFEKFLVNKQGQVVARFAPDVTVDHPDVVARIEAELAA